LSLVIVACVGFVVWQAFKEGLINRMSVAEKIDQKRVDDTSYTYENKISNYKITVPVNWNISEASSDDVFESRVEVVPTDLGLKVQKIDIDVMLPGKMGAALGSEEEFNKWDTVQSDTDIVGTTKLGEDSVSGQKVLYLADLTKNGDSTTDNSWSMLGWFRKDGRNFYVRMFALQDFTEADKQAFKYMIRTMDVK